MLKNIITTKNKNINRQQKKINYCSGGEGVKIIKMAERFTME